MNAFVKKCFTAFIICLPVMGFAASSWQIVPDKSELTFTATQNGGPVTGKFKKFGGEINFDPADLAGSHIQITIDTGSITDPYNQLQDTLQAPEWFNVKVFPQAVFKSDKIVKTGADSFEAQGMLTIRDKTLPVVLKFSQEELTGTEARMKGTGTIERTQFGVGQGEWADTKTVKDDVVINFLVTARKSPS